MNSNKKYNHAETVMGAERAHRRAGSASLGDIKISLLVKHNAWLLAELLDKAVEPYGLTGVEYFALVMLYSTPDNLANPSDLCTSMGETRGNMTRICDELVNKKLVRRITNLDDRRRVDLSLTEKGTTLLNTIIPALRKRGDSVFDAFSSEEKTALEVLLVKLKQTLEPLV